jgi:phage terminase large subunit-like protein
LKKVRELYEGTRLGRQELQGAMILDPMNALFKDDWLIHNDVPEGMIAQVTVGVDPSGGEDEVGSICIAQRWPLRRAGRPLHHRESRAMGRGGREVPRRLRIWLPRS